MAMKPRGEIEVIDPNTVMVQGYAAVTGVEFDYFDPREWRQRRMVIDPGAFATVLARLKSPVPMHWSHDLFNLQLGEIARESLAEDDTGLTFSGVPFATRAVIDQLTVMAGRERTGASFVFEFGEVAEDDDGVDHIMSFSDLFEVGPTPIGANPLAFAELVERSEGEEIAEPEPVAASCDVALAAAIHRARAQIRRF